MRLGAHQSIAGGLHRSIAAARRDGCEALQIFTRNQSQWRAKPLSEEAIVAFRRAAEAWEVPAERILAHDSYLINVCATDRTIRRKSRAALILELERCGALGIPWLVMHPGSHLGRGESAALVIVAEEVTRALEETSDLPEAPSILLENTAGQGTNLGYRLEHLRDLLGDIEPRSRVGLCIDTQHAWAAGYDLVSDEGYADTLATMERLFGLDQIRAFHLNDSKRELGSRVDRHELVCKGYLGNAPFRRLVNDLRFADLPGILELPPPYPPLLTRLRRLSDGVATPRRRPPRRGGGKHHS